MTATLSPWPDAHRLQRVGEAVDAVLHLHEGAASAPRRPWRCGPARRTRRSSGIRRYSYVPPCGSRSARRSGSSLSALRTQANAVIGGLAATARARRPSVRTSASTSPMGSRRRRPGAAAVRPDDQAPARLDARRSAAAPRTRASMIRRYAVRQGINVPETAPRSPVPAVRDLKVRRAYAGSRRFASAISPARCRCRAASAERRAPRPRRPGTPPDNRSRSRCPADRRRHRSPRGSAQRSARQRSAPPPKPDWRIGSSRQEVRPCEGGRLRRGTRSATGMLPIGKSVSPAYCGGRTGLRLSSADGAGGAPVPRVDDHVRRAPSVSHVEAVQADDAGAVEAGALRSYIEPLQASRNQPVTPMNS